MILLEDCEIERNLINYSIVSMKSWEGLDSSITSANYRSIVIQVYISIE